MATRGANQGSFSVRARTLGALVSGIVATAANIFWGWFYDLKCFSRPTLAKLCWLFFVVCMLGTFGWQVANEKMYGDSNPRVTLDWENPGFGRGFGSMVILRYVFCERDVQAHELIAAGF